ncbi:conserved hypothetical protein [Uncinocarpus reesii 1704]|uniref:Regulatory factor Sgt1 n=1 Tax=Uncinocarpus reesii (strain UAMH 1704) TaxID=336963 RepID=C4JW97_UNCRE|nr:uncharacterized protein UREG_06839 [Uncinocarpus reesii 1704]EEP81974.1 conserved hypothetical protein [Uncinocarpus reesii 1704]
MAPMSQEDIEWFKSTFHPIPKPELPDDCIEYSIYCVAQDTPPDQEDELVASRAELSKVQKVASELVKKYLKDYIWQRDSFKLELVKEDGVNLLRGRTEYGDSIEDEWVIVYILRELTRQFDNLWVKVTDSDGEFLLVEAAATLPAWLEPEVANNRVWIHKGELIIIKPGTTRTSKKKVTETMTFRDARKAILSEPSRLMRSPSIEEEAFYRLRNYPDQINKNMHSSLVTIPRTIAHLLRLKPAYVSPAVEAFYVRDPISLRALRSKEQSQLILDPEDLVTVSVKFTKVGFAQLKSQDFDPPKQWKGKLLFDPGSKEYARAEIGMKLACGFEMLLFDPQNQDKAIVREIKLILEDIETGDEKLPNDEDIDKNWGKQEDDESWLDINFEDLERELKGRKGADGDTKMGDFGDKGTQENLQRICRFRGSRLFNESDDGEIDDDDEEEEELSSDGEDKEASFDEEEFSKMMQEMMGLPSGASKFATGSRENARIEELESIEEEDENDSNRPLREELYQKRQGLKGKELRFSDEEADAEEVEPQEDEHELEEIEELSRQMEAELKKAGVLDPNRALREESKQRSKALKGKSRLRDIDDDQEENDEDYDDGSDVNINLARNLLESLRSQGGSAGPGSNLLGLMGMQIPKDDRR